jgi:hypothetical protein
MLRLRANRAARRVLPVDQARVVRLQRLPVAAARRESRLVDQDHKAVAAVRRGRRDTT